MRTTYTTGGVPETSKIQESMAEGGDKPEGGDLGQGDSKPKEEGVQISAATLSLLTGQSKSHAESFMEFGDIERPEEGKNKMFLVCDYCKCKVMRPGYGKLVEKEIFMPHPTEKYKIGTEPAGSTLSKFWLVEDMWHFENVGFSKTVGESVKYLICADCEVGPLGWHSLQNTKEFFIAAERVKYAAA